MDKQTLEIAFLVVAGVLVPVVGFIVRLSLKFSETAKIANAAERQSLVNRDKINENDTRLALLEKGHDELSDDIEKVFGTLEEIKAILNELKIALEVEKVRGKG